MASNLSQDPSDQIPQWRRILYLIQLKAPKPKKIECHIDIPTRPSYYGSEFHGELSRHEADELLVEDGCYLVRESQRNPGSYTLAIRFDNATKNFKLYYDEQKQQHYVGDKHFDNLDDLVADGLICFHVNLKAPEYIASMTSDPLYEESPYMKYRADLKRREQRERGFRSSAGIMPAGSVNPTPSPVPYIQNRQSMVDSPRPQSPVLPPRPATVNTNGVLTASRKPPQVPSSDPPARRNYENLESYKLPSSVRNAAEWMDIMQQEKPHNFKTTTFKSMAMCWCDFCRHFMWGLIQQGVECQDCGFKAHKKCSEQVPNDCMPSMKKLKRMFGLDLTTLLKATNKSIPYVVETCIEEIESRGLDYEGLYRVPGFKDAVDEIQRSFDIDGVADIKSCDDIATITSVLKSFFSQLPLPLITFDVYQKLTTAVSRNAITDVQAALIQLPTANYQTLKYLIKHLNEVASHRDKNMMPAENLARIFAPTLLQSPHTDPMEAVKMGLLEQKAIEILILYHNSVFER